MKYNVGDLVNVGPAYQGQGRYAPDGHSGLHTVVGGMGDDYYLARGDLSHERHIGHRHWTVIVNVSRLRQP